MCSIEWAAGLFEGEGCITTGVDNRANGKTRHHLRLQLGSTDEDVVRRFHKIVGLGSVGGPYADVRKPQYKPTWRWSASYKQAGLALAKMLPYLGERRVARAAELERELGT